MHYKLLKTMNVDPTSINKGRCVFLRKGGHWGLLPVTGSPVTRFHDSRS